MASESIYAPKSSGPFDGSDDAKITTSEPEWPPHPFLKRPMLYISALDAAISDKELAGSVFASCLPVKLNVDRSDKSAAELRGTVEFQTLEKAEKALATIDSPRLSINENPAIDPKGASKPLLIKQLPHGTEDADVYELFRPYGALQSVSRILTNPAGHVTGFKGMAIVKYYSEEDAQHAQMEMHCAEIEGKVISVAVDNANRKPLRLQNSAFSPSASTFVPSNSGLAGGVQAMNAKAPAFEPSPTSSNLPSHAPGHAMTNASGTVVDPCNLFCKNLDPSIDSNRLFGLFKEFGMIVSARVMRDDSGKSREFGFVSFKRAEDASKAMAAMNSAQVGDKKIVVRLHEPKSVRQDKLAAKFGNAFNNSGAGAQTSSQSSGIMSPGGSEDLKERRSSNSYFAAAEGGNGVDGVDLKQLSSMNATLRGDILRGGFSRRVKELDDVRPADVEPIVAALAELTLPEAVEALNVKSQLESQVKRIQEERGLGASDSASTEAKAPDSEHASFDLSAVRASLPAGADEREKLTLAVKSAQPHEPNVNAIIDLLMSLAKKERAMMMFSQDYLLTKIDEAKSIVSMPDDDDRDKENDAGLVSSSPLTKANLDKAQERGALLPSKNAKNGSHIPQTYTMTQLAKLPAVEIVKLATSSEVAHLPLPKADEKTVHETDAFIDGLSDLALQDQKQKVGDRLYKKVRSYGFKYAPKITIALLDSEDLRSLAHLMNSYEDCLREKVALHANAAAK